MYEERREDNIWCYKGDYEKNLDDPDLSLKPTEIYRTRNKSLYSILANVYNTNSSIEKYTPISSPRGLPTDLSPELEQWSNEFPDEKLYSSWLTFEELLNFDWNQKVKKTAFVDSDVAHLFGNGEQIFPLTKWPKDKRVSYAEYDDSGVEVSWIQTYHDACKDFIKEVISKIKPELNNYQDSRIVFWFTY